MDPLENTQINKKSLSPENLKLSIELEENIINAVRDCIKKADNKLEVIVPLDALTTALARVVAELTPIIGVKAASEFIIVVVTNFAIRADAAIKDYAEMTSEDGHA